MEKLELINKIESLNTVILLSGKSLSLMSSKFREVSLTTHDLISEKDTTQKISENCQKIINNWAQDQQICK